MLVKLAYAMQRLKKYVKKIAMINKDGGGGTILDFVGGHNCYEGAYSSWESPSPPTKENPALDLMAYKMSKFEYVICINANFGGQFFNLVHRNITDELQITE